MKNILFVCLSLLFFACSNSKKSETSGASSDSSSLVADSENLTPLLQVSHADSIKYDQIFRSLQIGKENYCVLEDMPEAYRRAIVDIVEYSNKAEDKIVPEAVIWRFEQGFSVKFAPSYKEQARYDSICTYVSKLGSEYGSTQFDINYLKDIEVIVKKSLANHYQNKLFALEMDSKLHQLLQAELRAKENFVKNLDPFFCFLIQGGSTYSLLPVEIMSYCETINSVYAENTRDLYSFFSEGVTNKNAGNNSIQGYSQQIEKEYANFVFSECYVDDCTTELQTKILNENKALWNAWMACRKKILSVLDGDARAVYENSTIQLQIAHYQNLREQNMETEGEVTEGEI